jgi:ribosomal protein S27AE
MSLNPVIAAAQKLALMGYRFTMQGDTILADYQGPGKPDPDQAIPLLAVLKAHKAKVREFLRYYCPKCGGVVFVGAECFLCEWLPQARSQDKDTEKGQGAFSCGKCGHFLPSRLNPIHGFGRCALEHLSKRPGAYPGKAACNHFEPPLGEIEPLRLMQ